MEVLKRAWVVNFTCVPTQWQTQRWSRKEAMRCQKEQNARMVSS